MRTKWKVMTGFMAVALLFGTAVRPVQAVPVATEILLLADVSGSLDDADFALQRDGYAAAFNSALVQNAIVANGPVAVSLVYWSSDQDIAVPWTYISNPAESAAFAAAIAAAPRSSSGLTRMAAAMDFGTGLFVGNGYEGQRLVMDISGDGADTDAGDGVLDAPNVRAARDNALASGVTTINALWIDDRNFFGDDPEDAVNALEYGNLNVIGGISPFQGIVQDFPEFEAAIIEKIGREVIPRPEGLPDGGTTAFLLGMSLLAIGFSRRFQK